jgi:hypothetical protein
MSDIYKQALINIQNCDYPNQYSGECGHGKYAWEDCEACIDAYIETVLTQRQDKIQDNPK